MMKKKVNLCLFWGYVKLAYVSYRAFKPIMTDVALLMLVTLVGLYKYCTNNVIQSKVYFGLFWCVFHELCI